MRTAHVGGDGPVVAVRFLERHPLDRLPDRRPLGQHRAPADHLARRVEHEARLVAVARRTVDLGTLFAVQEQHKQRDSGTERRLAVFPGDLDVGRPVSPGPVLAFPAEQGPHNIVGLPGFQLERLPGQRSLDVYQLLEELDRPVGSVVVEPVGV